MTSSSWSRPARATSTRSAAFYPVEKLGARQTRQHGLEPYAGALQFAGERSGEGQHEGLGAAIGAVEESGTMATAEAVLTIVPLPRVENACAAAIASLLGLVSGPDLAKTFRTAKPEATR